MLARCASRSLHCCRKHWPGGAPPASRNCFPLAQRFPNSHRTAFSSPRSWPLLSYGPSAGTQSQRRYTRNGRNLQTRASTLPAPKLLPCRTFIERFAGIGQGHPYLTFAAVVLGVPIAFWGFKIFSLVAFQNKVIYMPYIGQAVDKTPADVGLPCEEVWIRTRDHKKLQCWLSLQPESATCPTFLFFQGNVGMLDHRIDWLKLLYDKVGCNLLAVSYRGYGKSEGSPSQCGVEKDSEAALMYLLEREDISSHTIVAYGHSLGGAVAINLAARYPSNLLAVITENTFVSVESMMHEIYPSWSPYHLARHFLVNPWNSGEDIKRMELPFLALVGCKDYAIPMSQSEELVSLADCSTPKEIVYFKSGTHENTFKQAGYGVAISKFLSSIK